MDENLMELAEKLLEKLNSIQIEESKKYEKLKIDLIEKIKLKLENGMLDHLLVPEESKFGVKWTLKASADPKVYLENMIKIARFARPLASEDFFLDMIDKFLNLK